MASPSTHIHSRALFNIIKSSDHHYDNTQEKTKAVKCYLSQHLHLIDLNFQVPEYVSPPG